MRTQNHAALRRVANVLKNVFPKRRNPRPRFLRLDFDWLEDRLALAASLVADIALGPTGSSPSELIDVNGTSFFVANDAVHGTELWKSNGIMVSLVMDIRDGPLGSNPSHLINVAGTLFFIANNGVNGAEVWKTDGTLAGTMMVKDIMVGPQDSNPDNLTQFGSTLCFSANDGKTGTELWQSDGTLAGTHIVVDIRNGPLGSNPTELTTSINNSKLFFVANDGVHGLKLFAISENNGLTSLARLDSDSTPGNLTSTFGLLFFTAGNNHGLWQTDGGQNHTITVKDSLGKPISEPQNLFGVFGSLYFSARDQQNGLELMFTSGGTARLVKDINPGDHGFDVNSEVAFANRYLVFDAFDPSHGYEPWTSDGSSGGTKLLRDVFVGDTGSNPRMFTYLNGFVYFTATDQHGTNLWGTDRTPSGTILVAAIPGVVDGSIEDLAVGGNTLYFTALDDDHGREPWKFDRDVTSTTLAGGSNPSNSQETVSFTAHVSAPSGVPTGLVQFRIDGATLGDPVALDDTGNASITTDTLSVGSHSIDATFLGSAALVSSVAPQLTQVVNAATQIALTSTPNASTGGQLVTLTAAVTPNPGDRGAVTFLDGQNILSAGISLVRGMATFQTSTLSVGTHSFEAKFSGATGFAPSSSATLNFGVAINPPRLVSKMVNGNIASLIGPQRSRVVSLVAAFDQPVQLDPGALKLALHTNEVAYGGLAQAMGMGSVPDFLYLASDDQKTWTVTFGGNTEIGDDGLASLKDGVYDFTVEAEKVHPLGMPAISMTGPDTTVFHRLFGDANLPVAPGNVGADIAFEAVVNTGDNLAFRSAFNNAATYDASFDFNGDGIINTGDNFEFRSRFNKMLTWRV
jgi:ELWxxDGT repeat protein